MAEMPQGPTRGARRRRALSFVIAAFVLAGIGWLAWWYLQARGHETTDNAYVGGNLVQVTPQVAGTVVAIGADDTDLVEAGQTLVRLDPADAGVALAQAEAQLAQAVRAARTVYANNSVLDAAVAQRTAELRKAEDDLARRIELDAKGMVTKEDLEHARSAVAAAKAALVEARERLAANRALTERITVEEQPSVKDAAARVRVAFLAVARDRIPAPVTGYVAKRVVQVGQRVAPGDPLMAVVPLDEIWVDANFKEVQLRDMRIGQPARLTADLYGGRVEYRGRVAGLAAGTGGAFALLPPQNATGNWIKIVQRLPVRVALAPPELHAHPLRIGLSMQARVDTRDRSGPVLAAQAETKPVFATDVYSAHTKEADALIASIIQANRGALRR
ncbi:MAG TPA: efflux RND transporter periplasmic adaptor subunit [Burkholderiales bacterium]|nr:efflux RND transporter periplasmic adaptor subunit [Burkholderiales bacterium]